MGLLEVKFYGSFGRKKETWETKKFPWEFVRG